MIATMGGLTGRRIGLVTIAGTARSYLPVKRDVGNAIAGEAVSAGLLLGNAPSVTRAIPVANEDVQDAWLGGEPTKLAIRLLKQSYLQSLLKILKVLREHQK